MAFYGARGSNGEAPQAHELHAHRRGFGLPDLIEVQKNSYRRFLETDLREVLADVSPITDYNGNLVLEFVDYSLDEPKNTVERCKERDMTYAAPLKVFVRLKTARRGKSRNPMCSWAISR